MNIFRTRRWAFVTGICLCFAVEAVAQRRHARHKSEEMQFRFVGPIVGNRVAAIAGVAGDPQTYYAGAASGGVWKSTDGGVEWQPISDKLPVAAIGALAVAPSDPNIVWAGTGEAWAIRDTDVMGDGVYRSLDGGTTWTHMGLDATGRIGRILVDPHDPQIVFVCASGRMTGPQQERGVYRTADGGAHWDRVLFVDEKTGCSGLAMDPNNPRLMIAGTWQAEMHTYGEFSGGPGSGVFLSHDGGVTWKRVEEHGLPKSPVGKIDVGIAPTDPKRMYALIQTADQGSLWRSDDGGENWSVVNWNRFLIGRAGYYIRLAISPKDEDEILISNSSFFRSTDGGHTFKNVPWGGDNHDIWIDPKNADRIAVSDDGGINLTSTHGKQFRRVHLPIGQMYHVAVDNQVPYYVYGNMQDDGTMRGPSASMGYEEGGSAQPGWDHHMGGCESGFTLPDPADTNIVWSTCYGNEITRWDARTRVARSVSPWLHTLDSPPNDAKYRCHWTPPLAIDPFDHNTVYYGCQVIFKTSNAGQSWSVISPDLSTQDPSRNVSSGGLVADNLGQFYGEVVFAIAPSTVQKGLIWAGTNDGKVWNTRDGGGHWNDLTKNVPGIPSWGTITSIQPSFFDAGTAYVSVDAHLMDNRDPYIYKTTDFGATWTQISTNLPKHTLSYVRVVAEDPNQKGLLFAGTGNALYYTSDDGAHWTQLKDGLPPSPVSWIVVQKNFHDLVVSTYGRGFYILDDITPLEQSAKGEKDAAVEFFAPRRAYRFAHNSTAFLNYSVVQPSKDPAKIEIVDAKGVKVRELSGPATEGQHRVTWNLQYEGPKLVELRSTPSEQPHIWEQDPYIGKDSRPVTHWGMATEQEGPLVKPGKYTAKLTVNGHTYSQPLEVVLDPKSTATAQEIDESVDMQLRIRDEITKVAGMINRLEWMRKQLGDVHKMMSGDPSKKALLEDLHRTQEAIEKVEYRLIAKPLTLSDDKYYMAAFKVYFNLLWLNGEIGPGAGDVAGGNTFGPTDAEREELKAIEAEITTVSVEYDALLKDTLPKFNQALLHGGMTPVVVAGQGAENAPAGTSE